MKRPVSRPTPSAWVRPQRSSSRLSDLQNHSAGSAPPADAARAAPSFTRQTSFFFPARTSPTSGQTGSGAPPAPSAPASPSPSSPSDPASGRGLAARPLGFFTTHVRLGLASSSSSLSDSTPSRIFTTASYFRLAA